MKNLLIILGFTIILFSCKTQCEVSERKLEKIIEKCPDVLKDTVTVVDTVVLPPNVIYDTAFVTNPIDTIRIENDRQVIKIRRVYDKIYIDTAMCKTDTVIVTVEVPVEKAIIQPVKKLGFFGKLQKLLGGVVFWTVIIVAVLIGIFILGNFVKGKIGL